MVNFAVIFIEVCAVMQASKSVIGAELLFDCADKYAQKITRTIINCDHCTELDEYGIELIDSSVRHYREIFA